MPDNQSSTKPTHIPRGRFRGAFLFAMKRHLHAAGIYLCSKCNQWCTDFGYQSLSLQALPEAVPA